MNVQNVERSFGFGEPMVHYKGGMYTFMYDNVEYTEELPLKVEEGKEINYRETKLPLGLWVAKHTETGDILIIGKHEGDITTAALIQKNIHNKTALDEHELVVYMDEDECIWARPRQMFYEYLPERNCYRFEKKVNQ